MTRIEEITANPYKMYDYVPIGVCIISSDYTINYWNLCLEGWTGKTQKEMTGRNLLELYPHLNNPRYKVRIDLMFMGRPPMVFSSLLHHYFLPITDSNSETQSQSATLTSLPKNIYGQFDVLIAIENVTTLSNRVKKYRGAKNQAIEELEKRSLMEEKIKIYAQELEQLNATKDKFFSIIAHDLINPISTQQKIIESIVKEFKSYSKDDIYSIMTLLNNSANNTYRLLENLLTWSRSQLNKIECHKMNINGRGLIEDVIAHLRAMATAKSIEILVFAAPQVEVYADINMLTTVVRNILSNAIKFTHDYGRIDVKIEDLSDRICIIISDNGIGMDKAALDNIFQIDKSQSTPGTNNELGTGLGLVLCKEFIERNGGNISIESTKGIGTSFSIILPKK